MLTYLAVSSILNIVLGYALAVYLGQTRAPRTVTTAPQTIPPAAAPAAPPATTTPLAATAARLAPQPAREQAADDKGWAEAFMKSETAAEPAPSEPIAAESTPLPVAASVADALGVSDRRPVEGLPFAEEESSAGEPTPGSPEVEKELLAGIEEFRNQLAQLKGGAPEQAPASPPAAVAAN